MPCHQSTARCPWHCARECCCFSSMRVAVVVYRQACFIIGRCRGLPARATPHDALPMRALIVMRRPLRRSLFLSLEPRILNEKSLCLVALCMGVLTLKAVPALHFVRLLAWNQQVVFCIMITVSCGCTRRSALPFCSPTFCCSTAAIPLTFCFPVLAYEILRGFVQALPYLWVEHVVVSPMSRPSARVGPIRRWRRRWWRGARMPVIILLGIGRCRGPLLRLALLYLVARCMGVLTLKAVAALHLVRPLAWNQGLSRFLSVFFLTCLVCVTRLRDDSY